MTKTVKNKTHQSWAERLMSWKLSKPAIIAIFIVITGWCGKVFAEETKEENTWDVALEKVVEPAEWYEIMAYLGFLVLIVCFFVALFKKNS